MKYTHENSYSQELLMMKHSFQELFLMCKLKLLIVIVSLEMGIATLQELPRIRTETPFRSTSYIVIL